MVKASERTTGSLGEEDVALVEVKIFIHGIGVSGEISAQAAEVELLFGDQTVGQHLVAGADIIVSIVAVVTDFVGSAVSQLKTGGALHGDDVGIEAIAQKNQLMAVEQMVVLNLLAVVVGSSRAVGHATPSVLTGRVGDEIRRALVERPLIFASAGQAGRVDRRAVGGVKNLIRVAAAARIGRADAFVHFKIAFDHRVKLPPAVQARSHSLRSDDLFEPAAMMQRLDHG